MAAGLDIGLKKIGVYLGFKNLKPQKSKFYF